MEQYAVELTFRNAAGTVEIARGESRGNMIHLAQWILKSAAPEVWSVSVVACGERLAQKDFSWEPQWLCFHRFNTRRQPSLSEPTNADWYTCATVFCTGAGGMVWITGGLWSGAPVTPESGPFAVDCL